MTNKHVPQVVGIHLESFPTFFLSFLGPRFLHLLYYSIVASPHSVGFVYLKEGNVAGFVAGVNNPSAFYSSLVRRRLFPFMLAALAAAMRSPYIIPRLFRALLYPSHTANNESTATLMTIATGPSCQGQGIGKQLVEAFLSEMRNRGVRIVNLTTDRDNNGSVNGFYLRLGFTLTRTFRTRERRKMNEYEYQLRPHHQSQRQVTKYTRTV